MGSQARIFSGSSVPSTQQVVSGTFLPGSSPCLPPLVTPSLLLSCFSVQERGLTSPPWIPAGQAPFPRTPHLPKQQHLGETRDGHPEFFSLLYQPESGERIQLHSPVSGTALGFRGPCVVLAVRLLKRLRWQQHRKLIFLSRSSWQRVRNVHFPEAQLPTKPLGERSVIKS